MMTDAVAHTLEIAAARAQVWPAMDDAAQMGAWLLPPALGASLALDGDVLQVAMGPMRIPLARLELLADGQSLRLTGLPDAQVSLTFALAPLGSEQTQVTLQVAGLDALPAQSDEDRSAPVRAAAPRLLANLAAAVEGRDLPWPEGYLAAIFGYRREGATICGVGRSVWLPRTPEQVWPALSTPAGIEGWFSPGTPWVLTELAPQGRLFVRDPESGGELYTQIIARVEPPLLLVLNSLPTADGPAQSSDHILTPEAGGTRMTLTNYGYERLPADGRAATLEQTAFGFGMVMENFYASVMGEPLPYPGGF